MFGASPGLTHAPMIWCRADRAPGLDGCQRRETIVCQPRVGRDEDSSEGNLRPRPTGRQGQSFSGRRPLTPDAGRWASTLVLS